MSPLFQRPPRSSQSSRSSRKKNISTSLLLEATSPFPALEATSPFPALEAASAPAALEAAADVRALEMADVRALGAADVPVHRAASAEAGARQHYAARHAAIRSARRSARNRWAAGAVAVAVVGAIAAVGATIPWGGGSGLADAAHGGQASPSGLVASQQGGGHVSALSSASVQKVGQPTAAKADTHGPTAPSASARVSSHASARPAPKQATSVATPAPVPTGPVLFYDSVEPGVLPAGQAAAVYADGPFATSSAAVAGHGNVLWIDVNGSDPSANVLDVEPGDATPAGAAAWVSSRLTANPSAVAVVYTFIAEWPSVIDAINTLPASMQSHVKYWISDPTGVPHIVSGASATQWAWGPQYDSDEAEPGFFA